MHCFLTDPHNGLKGISLPLTEQSLLDNEFADDTTIYLQGQEENLTKMFNLLTTFCLASGARVNWNKSKAIWISANQPPNWSPVEGFAWIPRGTAIRYLGCQIGVDLPPEAHVAPLLTMLRRKLLHWSSAQLSLAGRVVVANNVLLASIWFVASSCMFSRSCLEQLRRLIRNFIWSGKDKDNVRAKVAWKTLIQPKSKGGLGLIDPWQQSKALLSKFLVCSLRPDAGPWSLFLQECLQCCAPNIGGPWKKDTRWFCEQSSRIPRFEGSIYKLINGILQSWREIREALMQLPPAPNEEQMRQPLIWNTFFSTPTGELPGQQPRLAWEKIVSGPAATWEQWQTFSQQSPNQQKQELEKIYGHKKMMSLLHQCR